METTVNIIKIGNSLGIILPSKILKRLELEERDKLNVNLINETITLSSKEKDNTEAKNPFSAISKGGWYGINKKEASELSDFLHETRVDSLNELAL